MVVNLLKRFRVSFQSFSPFSLSLSLSLYIYIWFIIRPGKSEKKSWKVLEFEFIFLVGTMLQLTKTFFSLRARQFFKLAKCPRTTMFDKINFFLPNFVFGNGNMWGGWKCVRWMESFFNFLHFLAFLTSRYFICLIWKNQWLDLV